MRVWLGLFLVLFHNGMRVQAKAQVLVTARGEPAPFPHFPSVSSPAPPAENGPFQFAPTPSGRAQSLDETPLPDINQALEQKIAPVLVPAPIGPPGAGNVSPTPTTLVVPNSGTNAAPLVVGDHSDNPNFHYNYGVSDPTTGDQKSHVETREGDVVKGKYSFVDSDGSIRTVTYTADPIHGFQAVVEQTPPSLRKATAPLLEQAPAPVVVNPQAIPPVLAKIPGVKAELLTEADLLLADPATHTHPLGSHSLLPIHPGYDQPHSHPPFNQHPVIDMTTGEVVSEPEPELLQLHPVHHPVHVVQPTSKPLVDEGVNSIHALPPGIHHPKPLPIAARPVPHHTKLAPEFPTKAVPAVPAHPIHHSTPIPHHSPTPVPHVPHHAPHHIAHPAPTHAPHHIAHPVPTHAPHHIAPHHGPTHAPHHGPPHAPHAALYHPQAPVPLGYRTEVPVKYHELRVPHGGPYKHSPYPPHHLNGLHYNPYKPTYPPHYNPFYRRRLYH